MTIETKFNINDLVQHKYQRPGFPDKGACAFEVIDIHANCCYTTAQVFYFCRPIHLMKKGRVVDGKMEYEIADVAPARLEREEYGKFREDELKECDQAVKDEILKV